MWLYAAIMLLVGGLFLGLSIAIYKGKTDLIHDYHQTRVTDKAAYGKAFGKALSVIAVGMLLSGIVNLFGESETVMKIAVAVLIVGLASGLICIFIVQRKYNKGIF